MTDEYPITIEQARADYITARRLYVSGVRSVQFGDRMTMYGGTTDLESILRFIQDEIATLTTADPRPKQTLVYSTKGF